MPTSIGARIDLDVFLRDRRHYVQGTQLIARACERFPGLPTNLRQATFSRITDKNVWLLPPCVEAPVGEVPVGNVKCLTDIGEVTCQLYESSESAPRQFLAMDVEITRMPDAGNPPLAGRFAFRQAGVLEGLLNVMVQSIKALHEGLDPEVRDVWFTGLRQFDLPLSGEVLPERGWIEICPLRVGSRGEQYQSLSQVTFRDHNQSSHFAGVVSFAFRSAKRLHVH